MPGDVCARENGGRRRGKRRGVPGVGFKETAGAGLLMAGEPGVELGINAWRRKPPRVLSLDICPEKSQQL